MWSKDKSRAKKLREVLSGFDLELEQSECNEVILQIDKQSHNIAQAPNINDDKQLAEQYLDELLEGVVEVDYAKFTRRFEEKYLAVFTEVDFKKSIQSRFEEMGDYVRREFMGCLNGMAFLGDDRYPNQIRHVWRCYFDKNEVLISVGIYHKDGTYYVCNAGSL